VVSHRAARNVGQPRHDGRVRSAAQRRHAVRLSAALRADRQPAFSDLCGCFQRLAADVHESSLRKGETPSMTRVIATLTVVLAFTLGLATRAQEVKSKTTIKADDVKTVTYTGCLQTGTEARTYILDKVVPIGETTKTTAGTSGTITTTTTT